MIVFTYCCLIFISSSLWAHEVYDQIKDIHHPTLNDYRFVQHFLTHGQRDDLKLMNDHEYENRFRAFKLIGERTGEEPESGIITVNTSKDDKTNCLILYSSFNRFYPQWMKRLISHVKNSDYRGHILYRLGGWPNVENGDLRLAHVPYAFKVCFFKEAQRLGYQRVLWLDCSVIPLVSLNVIFDMIEEKGYFVMGNYHCVGPFMNAAAAAPFGVSLKETFQIPSCSAGLLGIDFRNSLGTSIIDYWNQAAHHETAFFSARSDQNALSIILYLMGISDFIDYRRLPYAREQIQPDSLFLIQGM